MSKIKEWNEETRNEVRRLEKEYEDGFMRECGVDASKLIPFGDMNLILQCSVFLDEDGAEHIEYDNYMPRKNRVYTGYDDITKEDLVNHLKDTKERLKMYSRMIDEFIDGNTNRIYYWEPTFNMKDKYVLENIDKKFLKDA